MTRTILKVVGGLFALYFLIAGISLIRFANRLTRRAEAVREKIKTGMTPAEVVDILEHPDEQRPSLSPRHYFVLQALNAAGKAACAAGKPLREDDCEEYRGSYDALGQFPEALDSKIKATGKAEVWKAEIHADYHIFMESEYAFVVSFGQDGKVASVGDESPDTR